MGLRAPLKLTLLVAVTLPLYAGWVLTRPVAWVVPSSERALQRMWVGTWARCVLRILRVRARYEGPVPEGPYFLVANHLSYVDIPLLLARLDARFLAKSEIAGWPVMGLLARTTGTLFVDRSRKRDLTRVLGEVKRVLARGPGVIVFPEATSTDGAAVERFKPSLFEVPVEVDVSVRCAALHYHAPDGPRPAWEAVCWWGDAGFGPHFFQFLKQGPTDATVTFSAEIPPEPAGSGPARRKELCQAAQELVERSFTPSRPPSPARPEGTTAAETPPPDPVASAGPDVDEPHGGAPREASHAPARPSAATTQGPTRGHTTTSP